MADFNQCIQFVLNNETFVGADNKLITVYKDKTTGEFSNYGISQKFLQLIKYKITDPTLLQMSDILALYQTYFWNPYYLRVLSSNLVAQKILDMLVNMGPFEGSKGTQAALNSKGFACVIDGIIGPHTTITIEQCVKAIGEFEFVQELALKSESYYRSLTIPNAKQDLPVWLARARKLGVDVNYVPKNS